MSREVAERSRAAVAERLSTAVQLALLVWTYVELKKESVKEKYRAKELWAFLGSVRKLKNMCFYFPHFFPLKLIKVFSDGI